MLGRGERCRTCRSYSSLLPLRSSASHRLFTAFLVHFASGVEGTGENSRSEDSGSEGSGSEGSGSEGLGSEGSGSEGLGSGDGGFAGGGAAFGERNAQGTAQNLAEEAGSKASALTALMVTVTRKAASASSSRSSDGSGR